MTSRGRGRGRGGNNNRNGKNHANGDGGPATVHPTSSSMLHLQVEDPRLHYDGLPYGQRETRQAVLGSQYITVEPSDAKIESIPKQLDFDLPSNLSLLFGPMSRFRVKGTFQKKEENADAWTNLSSTEASQVLLCSNWLDFLIKELCLFQDNRKVASSTENRYIVPFVNSFLYHNMEAQTKRMLCPQSSHPGLCTPAPNGKWNKDASSWTDYAKAAFPGSPISFDYTPLLFWPLHQPGSESSSSSSSNMPRILPASTLGRMLIRIVFTDSQDHIFRNLIEANKNTKYRFAFSEFKLVLEEARLSPSMEQQLNPITRPLAFPGITRIQLVEQVTPGSSSWRARFQQIYLPEALFICALNKTAASGPYNFAGDAGSSGVFSPHNLESVDLSFDGKCFAIGEPQMGSFRRDKLDVKSMQDHLVTPPFGIRQNPKFITADYVANGGSNTAYPHVYLPLTMGGPDNGQRRVPWTAHTDNYQTWINKKANLDIDLTFTEETSPAHTVYVIFAIYSDVGIMFDPQSKLFLSPYLEYMSN